mmetsp:Transcript_37461/g.62319  ORF Transcript_37461/g.62319 Transcript_37461/m.62319 type:complete len:207 (+) Transcript_37461:809-1429(+)
MILIKIRQPPLAEFCSATNTDDAELGTLIITLSIKIHVLEIRELQFGSIRKLLWVLLLDLLPSLASLQLPGTDLLLLRLLVLALALGQTILLTITKIKSISQKNGLLLLLLQFGHWSVIDVVEVIVVICFFVPLPLPIALFLFHLSYLLSFSRFHRSFHHLVFLGFSQEPLVPLIIARPAFLRFQLRNRRCLLRFQHFSEHLRIKH